MSTQKNPYESPRSIVTAKRASLTRQQILRATRSSIWRPVSLLYLLALGHSAICIYAGIEIMVTGHAFLSLEYPNPYPPFELFSWGFILTIQCLVAYGASTAQRLISRGTGNLLAIFCLTPFSSPFWFYWPLGLWLLVVLNQRKTKVAFALAARERDSIHRGN